MSKWIDSATRIRGGEELHEGNLAQYLRSNLPHLQGELEVQQFPSGFSNLTYFLKVGKSELVLRNPPFGANIKSAHDMSREYSVLSGLHPVYSKAPQPVLYCEDENVLGAPFYIMERVRGVILRPRMPKEMYPDPQQMSGIANSFVDCLVELHAVDYTAAGLAELGRPEGYVQRQVEGWSKRYQKAKTDDITEMDIVAGWLAVNFPPEQSPTLIHNDFKYDNIVLDGEDWTSIIAVLDWEMTTIGDPLMDLGTSIGYWVNDNDPAWMQQLSLSPTTYPGNPRRGELVERYARQSGRDVGQIVFYYVYGIFKIAVICQQIYYRYKHGYTKDPRFAVLIDAIKGLGVMGQQAIAKGRIDDLF